MRRRRTRRKESAAIIEVKHWQRSLLWRRRKKKRAWTRRIDLVVKQLNHQQAVIVSFTKLFVKSNCSKTFCIIASSKKSRQNESRRAASQEKERRLETVPLPLKVHQPRERRKQLKVILLFAALGLHHLK